MDPSQQPGQPPQPQPTPQAPPQPAPSADYSNQPPAGFQPAQPVSPANQPPQPAQAAPPPGQPVQLPTGYAADYLDQIAGPVPTKNTKGVYLLWAIIILSIITAGVLAFTMLSNRPTSMSRATELYLRMETLKKVSENTHRQLRSNDLRVSNRSFSLFLTNAIRDIEAPIKAAGIKKSEIPKSIRNREAALSSQLKDTFDEALLNVSLDRVYAREMTYQLNTLQAMMKAVGEMSSNKEILAYLETTNSNLAPVMRSFSEFAATK